MGFPYALIAFSLKFSTQMVNLRLFRSQKQNTSYSPFLGNILSIFSCNGYFHLISMHFETMTHNHATWNKSYVFTKLNQGCHTEVATSVQYVSLVILALIWNSKLDIWLNIVIVQTRNYSGNRTIQSKSKEVRPNQGKSHCLHHSWNCNNENPIHLKMSSGYTFAKWW